MNHTRIARELGVSRTTVIKYATRDYSPSSTGGRAATRSLMTGEYARAADEWLTSDLRLPRKQRHTARRVHERLVAELGFPGGYSSVQRWVKRRREAHRRDSDGYAELEWSPGTAQVDYGLAKAVVAGVERTVHFLAVSFPYPDHAVRGRAARGDHRGACATACRWCSHMRAWRPGCWCPDDATGVGRRGSDGTVALTRLFSLFCAHHGFEARCPRPVCGPREGQRGERGRVRAMAT